VGVGWGLWRKVKMERGNCEVEKGLGKAYIDG
jgi:hypothetical protein